MTKLVALHHQVYLTLRNQLLSGAYVKKDGTLTVLPSEVELSKQFGVSRVTIRRSLDTLESENLIVRRHGAGTFPVPLPAPERTTSESDLAGFYREIATRAYGYGKNVLAYGPHPTPPDILAESPDFGPTCMHIAVVSERDGEPVHVNRQYVAARFVHLFEKDRGEVTSLLLALRAKGITSASVDLTISSAEADLDAARRLKVRVGAALLSSRRTSRLADGTAFEYLDALTRPDRFTYRLHYGDTHSPVPPLHEEIDSPQAAPKPRKS